MEQTLVQLTEQIKQGNDTNELLLIENFVMLEEIHGVLASIENKITSFFKTYQDQIIAQREADIEANRLTPPPTPDGGGVGDDTPDGQRTSGGTFAGIAALLTVAKMFDVDELIRLPATLTVMFKKIKVFGDTIRTMGGMLGQMGEVVGRILKPIGTLLKPLGTLFSKLALPITIIFGVLDAIEGFTKTYADTGSILRGIRGAIVAVLDGLVGSLVRFAGEIVAFIPDIIGLDAVAETIKNLTSNITDGLLKAFGGILDIVLGLFDLGSGQFTEGLKSLFGGLWDALTEAFMFPINTVINFVRDIFGFSEEDAPPFRMQDLIGEAVDSIQQWFSNLFDFEFPSFDFDMNSVLRGLLPAPDSFFAKFIPDSVYQSVGINPETGEALETPETQRRGAEIPSQAGEQVQTPRGTGQVTARAAIGIPSQAGVQVQAPRGTGEVTARGAMGIPGPSVVQSTDTAQTSGFFESVTNNVSQAIDTVSVAVSSTTQTLTNLATSAVDNVSQSVSETFSNVSSLATSVADNVSENVIDPVLDTIDDVGNLISVNVVDPVVSFFSSIGSKISELLDVSGMIGRIKDYMTNMFAEVGIPRVELDVPVIGKVGFGPFYPFAPENQGTTRDVVNAANAVEIDSQETDEGYTRTEAQTSRVTNIEGVQNSEFGNDLPSGVSVSVRSYDTVTNKSDQQFDEQSKSTSVFGKFDYETGKSYINFEKTLAEDVNDQYRELENVTQRYEVGPLTFGKVRRMIDAGASPEQVKQFLQENEKSIAEKVSNFLGDTSSNIASSISNVTSSLFGGDQTSNVFGSNQTNQSNVSGGDQTSNVTSGLSNMVTSLFGGDQTSNVTSGLSNMVTSLFGGDQTSNVTSGLSNMVTSLFGGDQTSNVTSGLSNMVTSLFGGDQTSLSAATSSINNASTIDRSTVSNVLQSINPVANKALTAPVGEASTSVQAARQGATNILAPTTNNISPVNNTSVTNVNRTTVASASARSNDPSFMRLQNAFA